jgi:fructosamine-3-kinase
MLAKIELHINETIVSKCSVSGGCIANAQKIITESGKEYFLKSGVSVDDVFLKEANGLNELANSKAIHIPKVVLVDDKFLLLEFISSSRMIPTFWEDFGVKFALMHKFTSDKFGFFEDNYIGNTVQVNIPNEKEANSWEDFYFNKRLLFQVKLAEKSNLLSAEFIKLFSQLEKKYHQIMQSDNESPSLLHGDLWSGNFIVDAKGEACLIDPAVYYGNREADLAMTKLFGGFDYEFYQAYNREYPLQDGWQYREAIYKLYHVINHINLFGSSYHTQAIQLMREYV